MSLQSFLDEIYKSLQAKDGQRIADLIHLDVESLPPPRQQPYVQLNAELNRQYAANNDDALLQRCKAAVTQEEFGTFSTSFCESIARYFRYLRDIQSADNLTKALEIRQLTSQCVTALGDSRYGVVMIPIVLSFSRTLAFIATKLDRNPALIRQHASAGTSTSGDGTSARTSFVEETANVLKGAFTKCLTATSATPRTSRPQPDDKRSGIYLTANLTLKLLFRCLKQRNAREIFNSVDAQSPPLAFYPAAQRVTYLFYLGRYHFANNHFLRASAALRAAYTICHPTFTTQLRQIITYLLASNLIIGLLPSPQLFAQPHVSSLAPIFLPIITTLRTGDIGTFHAILSLPSPVNNNQPPNPIAAFLLHHRIHLQLLNRLEPLVYRTLILRCFTHTGFHAGGSDRKIPFLRLHYVRAAARFSFTRAPIAPGTLSHTALLDHDFVDLENALAETGYDIASGVYHSDNISNEPQANPFSITGSGRGSTNGHGQRSSHDDAGDHDDDDNDDDAQQSPTGPEIHSTFLSLIRQGFLRGFVSGERFAVPGADKRGGWKAAGFPSVYRAILEREGVTAEEGGEGGSGSLGLDQVRVPGWVKEGMLAGAGGGRVVKLTGARPVGAAAGL